MSINELISVVPPPATPLEAGSASGWASIERDLGIRFPSDYRDFANTYGSGGFGNPDDTDIWIYQPFWSRYKAETNEISQVFSQCRLDYGVEMYPFAVFPESPGLLIWGRDEENNHLFWLTEGEPDEWPIIIWDRGDFDEPWERHEGPMTTFLAMAFTRKIDVAIWSEPYFEDPSKFVFRATTEY